MKNSVRHLTSAALVLVFCSNAKQVSAQAVSLPEKHTAEDADDGGISDIIVTAQRREEKAQSVPISITSLTGDGLEKTGYTGLTDLQYVVPGLQYDPKQGAAFQIRGVGSTSFDLSNAKSVNVVVDDVVMDNQRDTGIIGLSDVAGIDVLMGPQGTLFGKNSTSGVISITTNKPLLGVFSGNFYGSYGERNDHNLHATLNVPVGQDAALRVTGFELGQEGFGRYVTLNKTLGFVHEYGVRAKLLYKPTDALSFELAGEYAHHYDTSVRTYVGGPANSSFSTTHEILAEMEEYGVTAGRKNADSADNHIGSITTENKGVSLHINYELGANTLTSITAYRRASYINDTPTDLLPDTVNAHLPFNIGYLYSNKFSEEVHFASPTGGFFEYLVGAFYNRLNARQDQVQWGPLSEGPVYDADGVGRPTLYANSVANDPETGELIGNTRRLRSYNETAAVFGQVKFAFTPRLMLSLGGRYNYDWNGQTISYFDTDPLPLTGYSPNFIASGTAPPAEYRHGKMHAGYFTYRVAPQFFINPNVMVYATYSTGYKPGGIAFVGNKYDPYSDETVRSWEAGFKSDLFDHYVRFNFDLYSSKYTDFQATILTPVVNGDGSYSLDSAIGNAPGLRSRGFETSLTVAPTRSLTLGGSVTYSDAIFTDYEAKPTANYTGTRLTNAPRWMFTIAADYDHDVSSSFKMNAHVDYAYRSDTQTVTGAMLGDWTAPARENADGTSTPNASYSYVPAYGLVNVRLSLSTADNAIEVGAYARNLFNTYFSTGYQIYGSLGLLHYTSPNAYRTIGTYLKYKF